MQNIKIIILQRVFKRNNALFYFEYPNKATNLDTGKHFEDNRVYNSHQQYRLLPPNYIEAEREYLQNEEYYEQILLKYLNTIV
jgi:hypothetical protein